MKYPVLVPKPKSNMYKLVQDYTFEGLTIKKGYKFNGANIPPIAQFFSYTPFHPDVMPGALVHDYLYEFGICSRKNSDITFRKILVKCGVDPELAWRMYYAVRLFGKSSYEEPENSEGYLDLINHEEVL